MWKQKLLLSFLLFFALVSSASAILNDADLFYSFDDADLSGGNPVDVSGVNVDGTTVGATTGVSGVILQAFDFDGTNDYVNTNNISIVPWGTNTVSVGGWVSPDSFSGVDTIIGSVENGGSGGLLFQLSSGRLELAKIGVSALIQSGVTLSTGGYSFVVGVANSTGMYLYINGSLVSSNANTANINQGGSTRVFVGARAIANVNIDQYFDGKIEMPFVYHRSLSEDEINDLFNSGNGLNPYTPTSSNFSVTVLDEWDGSAVNNVTLTLENGTSYSNMTGNVIETDVLLNESVLLNYTLSKNGFPSYYNRNYTNVNLSTDASNTLYKEFNFLVHNFTNYITFNSTNYTRELNIILNITCPTTPSSNIKIYADDIISQNNNPNCNGENNGSLQTITYEHDAEGNYTLKIGLNTTNNDNNINSSEYYFTSDLFDPIITVLDFTVVEGFGSANNTFSMQCTDTITPTNTYNLSFEGTLLFYGNLSNNTLLTNTSSTPLSTGSQTITGVCSDYFGSVINTTTKTVYSNTLILIDEQENAPFDVSNITGARVYYDDNRTFFDFKTNNTNNVTFGSTEESKLRFEFTYSGGTIITRWVDVSLVPTSELRVCVFEDKDLTVYPQIIVSNSEQAVAIKNVFSDCYIGVDYTRFAFENNQVLNAYTITSLYYLYKYVNGNPVYLASIDGSKESSIQLDVLEFSETSYDVSILRPIITIGKSNLNSTVIINYFDPRSGVTSAVLSITDLDNDNVVFSTSLLNVSSATVYFDYSTLNYTNNTLFEATVSSVLGGETTTTSIFFDLTGSSGSMRSELAVVLSLLLLVFGLTFTRASLALSWLGLLVVIASLFILGQSVVTPAVLLMMGVNGVLLLYILVTMFSGQTEVEVIK